MRPVLADFGLSRSNNQEDYYSRDIVGTLEYMSPEAFLLDYGPYSDVWAFGVMLFQILCGELPFVDIVRREDVKRQILGW